MSESVFFCNYSIGTDAYERAADVCAPFGTRILLIGGEKALQAGEDRLKEAIAGSGLGIVDTELFGADCTFKNIHRLAERARECQADMIFGMGGGKALDTAKGAAGEAGLPVFTFPTIAATCAGTTALSVVYREDGNFERFAYFDRPARHCFLDLEILAKAPAKYLRAGMGDTIGKYFECHFAARGDELAHSSLLGREISNLCYEPVLRYGEQALDDCELGEATKALEEVILANVVSTGLVSLLVLDQYNGAVAHSVYYGLVLLPGFEERFLHGDVVGYGVLVQLALDKDLEEARRVKRFLTGLQVPTSLREMGIPVERQGLLEVLRETVAGPDMEHIPYPVTEDMIFEAMELVETL